MFYYNKENLYFNLNFSTNFKKEFILIILISSTENHSINVHNMLFINEFQP
jgi:hypothetical protein